jgi:hypothetical protein
LEITKAKPVPTPEADAAVIAEYEFHKKQQEERDIINEKKRAARKSAERGIVGSTKA